MMSGRIIILAEIGFSSWVGQYLERVLTISVNVDHSSSYAKVTKLSWIHSYTLSYAPQFLPSFLHWQI